MGKHDNDPNTPLKQLAPEGYHIPTKNEYETLINFYGGLETAWVYLKTTDFWYGIILEIMSQDLTLKIMDNWTNHIQAIRLDGMTTQIQE